MNFQFYIRNGVHWLLCDNRLGWNPLRCLWMCTEAYSDIVYFDNFVTDDYGNLVRIT